MGAGVSIPAGMPSTEQLTEAVLPVTSYQLNQDEYFEKVNSENCDCSWPEKKILLELLLRNLKDRCEDYFEEKEPPKVNYEDIFFAASQLEEHLLEEYENPAIEPFTKALLKDLKPILLKHLVKAGLQGSTTLSRGRQLRIELRELAGLACYYIRSVVMLELRGEPALRNHLTCLIDAINDPRVASCDIFTLNHDLLIEEILHKHGLAFVDGFAKPENGMAEWDPGTLEKPSGPPYLLKLHGSINWVDRPGKVPVKMLTGAWEGLRDERGNLRFPGQAHPKMLVGTFNKIRDYYETPYFDLAAVFRRQLRGIDWLVVSGYSFGDKGINTTLSEWLDSHRAATILVLHARGDRCLDRARGAIRRRRGRMRFHEWHLCESNWGDLRSRYID